MIKYASARHWLFVVLLSLAIHLAGAAPETVAKTVYDRSGLSTCVPDADDPCADIAAPGTGVRIGPSATSGRMRVEQSPIGNQGSAAGAEPLPLTIPDLRVNKLQPESKAANYVNTTIVERNTTPYSVYWRVFAIRSGEGWAWPSGSTYYTAKRYSAVTKLIKCIKGEALYFGATSANGKFYWGYSADGNQQCTSGCKSTCTGGTLTITLSY